MLLSAGLPLPQQVFAHGFFTVNGEKMSKSLDNVIDPISIVEMYNNDTLRFFLLTEIHFGEDGDFSEERLKGRYEKALANELGNLVSRTLAMTENYLSGLVPEKIDGFVNQNNWQTYHNYIKHFSFHEALDLVWEIIRKANQFVEEQKPWVQAKEDKEALKKTLYILLETIRHIGLFLIPFMPNTSLKIFDQLGFESSYLSKPLDELSRWGGLEPGQKVIKKEILFPKK